MVQIKVAEAADASVLALLGRITYNESHSQFIEDKNDLLHYNETAFSVSKIKQDLSESNNIFYIIYVDDLPVGYAKLILNKTHENIQSKNTCLLDKIYLLDDFIPMKIGQVFLTFLETKAKELNVDTMWLTVYIKNERAIRFYLKNEFKDIGDTMFIVSGKEYENKVLSKVI